MVTFNPIGKVVRVEGRYYIELDAKYKDAALGLDEYSHIWAVWWFNLYDSEETRNCFTVDKPYKNGPEKVGVLSTRGSVRPNPVAITACAILGFDKHRGMIEVDWIEAEEGTPVLDLKPYHPSEDRVRDVMMPDWCAHWPKWREDSGDFDWGAEFNFPE